MCAQKIELSVDLRHKCWGLLKKYIPTCEAYVNPSQFGLSSIHVCIVTNTPGGKNSGGESEKSMEKYRLKVLRELLQVLMDQLAVHVLCFALR